MDQKSKINNYSYDDEKKNQLSHRLHLCVIYKHIENIKLWYSRISSTKNCVNF